MLTKFISGALILISLGYYGIASARYLSSDPIGLEGGPNTYTYVDSVGIPLTPDLNTYSYARNNPLKFIDPTGLFWEYAQGSGQLTYVDNQTGARSPVVAGYSGHGPGLNNPAMQNVRNVGPIPQGVYDIGSSRDSRRTGPAVLPLTPQPGTNTFGRTGFLFHGDNSRGGVKKFV